MANNKKRIYIRFGMETVSAASPHQTPSTGEKIFLAALDGEPVMRRPIWLMRQAGRYLSEYRQIRQKAADFLNFCYSPRLAAEATLQPITRFGFDAAILFSDILVIPDALGQKVTFETGEGPRLDPLMTADEIERLPQLSLARLEPVFETIDRVRPRLPSNTAFIGFCGAPWTVASYMVAGRGTPDQAPARLFAYRHTEAFQRLIDKLVDASVDYLIEQFRAGVDAVQIFDSWAGVLPKSEFERWCLEPVVQIVTRVRNAVPHARIIAFPRGANTNLAEFCQRTPANAISLDTAVAPNWAAEVIPANMVIQGHLDPLVLLAGGKAQSQAVAAILNAYRNRGHVFNLGHGILPETPVEHVRALVEQVRSFEV